MTQPLHDAIAVIGMAGRFPGADNIDQFWANLRAGVESISTLTDEQMREGGVDEATLAHPKLVRRKGVIGDADKFDAEFFGYTPREAKVMDPQQRVFLECAWAALEHAGYDPDRYDGLVGVFAGMSLNRYLLHHLRTNPGAVADLGELELLIGGDKDFLASRLSYKFNLRGPSVVVQTACSTSLSAIVQACQALLAYQCDMALAGGVAISVPLHSPYVHQQGGITSPDGHCRAFDARACGTVPSSGAGIVTLKRLDDAIADRDTIYAVVRGGAVNNDGSDRVGFTAPSVTGQAAVIAMAHAQADVPAESISYVEAHGTGTELGDPIEVQGLTEAFASAATRKGTCALGSVKTNIGHLDAAAGVAGFIKTVLALHHRELPPSLHFEKPNPKIDFDAGPFYVNASLQPWKANGEPRRAGVSSFGMGGVNAHVVLEEAPPLSAACKSESSPQLLLLSARDEVALREASAKLAAHLRDNPQFNLTDVAYTLQVGRRHFACRRAVVAASIDEAIAALARDAQSATAPADCSVAFMFPGQGSQHVDMLRGVYDSYKTFRTHVDTCCEKLQAHLNLDLRELLYPNANQRDAAAELLAQTRYTQPALFVVQYALAQLWLSWGIRPSAMIGHSIGEYAAACIAGVMSVDDALRIVAARGKLMQEMQAGTMLAVPLSEADLTPRLRAPLELAAVNGSTSCVVSGPADAVETFERELQQQNVAARRLHTAHAFHSASMEPALAPFRDVLRSAKLSPPKIPYVSNLTGDWITDAQACNPGYYAQQLRRPVRFHAGVTKLVERDKPALLEVGPGTVLTTLTAARGIAVPSARHPRQQRCDAAAIFDAVGKLWLAGAQPDWAALHHPRTPRRVGLPTYPFQRKRYWFDSAAAEAAPGQSAASAAPQRKDDIADWFYLPAWRQADQPSHLHTLREAPRNWLLIGSDSALTNAVRDRLRGLQQSIIWASTDRVSAADFQFNASSFRDWSGLYEFAKRRFGGLPDHILDLSAVGSDPTAGEALRHALNLFKALALDQSSRLVHVTQVTDQFHSVLEQEAQRPGRAAGLGVATAALHEIPHLRVRAVDLPAVTSARAPALAEALLNETLIEDLSREVAYRGRHRYIRHHSAVRLDAPATARLRERGVYLITGGLTGIGLAIATELARRHRARLVLISRSARRNEAVEQLESLGAEVHVAAADIADATAVAQVARDIRARFGEIHGILHSAGIAPGGMLAFKMADDALAILAPKVEGFRNLLNAFSSEPLDFFASCSSLAAILGVVGQCDYAAANAVLDALAHAEAPNHKFPIISINWDTWSQTGMAANSHDAQRLGELRDESLAAGIPTQDGVEAFFRLIETPWPQVIISTHDLATRLAAPKLAIAHDAPSDSTAPAQSDAPATTEAAVASIWQRFLGVDELDVDADFFQLGGHSLLAVQIIHAMQEQMRIDLSVDALFTNPTVRGLAAEIDVNRTAADTSAASATEPQAEDEDEDDEAALLAMIEQMSDEEVQQLLDREQQGAG